MRARASTTAAVVAFVRALGAEGLTEVQGFSDPFARKVLPLPWRLALHLTAQQLRFLPAVARNAILSRLDAVALRTRAIDLELERAVHAGAGQVVMLGAGLDTRAFRMQALGCTHVFEVDHPATQAFKRRKVADLSPRCRALSFVAVNFERDSLAHELTAAGYRREVATAWVWEGVVMYLTDDALEETLRSIRELSTPGSELIVHYHEPDTRGPAVSANQLATRLLGEPQLGLRSRQQLRERVEKNGFRVLRDTGTEDWVQQLRPTAVADFELHRVSRLLVALST
jgi:methyltransferase (TIGR00027 family)